MGEEAKKSNLNLKMLCGININSEVSTFVSGTPYAIPFSNKWNKNLSIVERKIPLFLIEMWYISKCSMPQFDDLT